MNLYKNNNNYNKKRMPMKKKRYVSLFMLLFMMLIAGCNQKQTEEETKHCYNEINFDLNVSELIEKIYNNSLTYIKNILQPSQNLKNMVWHYLIQNSTKLLQKF